MTELLSRFSFFIRPKPPYAFGLTIRKPAGWPLFTPQEVFERETLWTALHLREGLVGVKLRSRGTIDVPRIGVDVFLIEEPSLSEKKAIRDALNLRLGANQDLTPFYRAAKKDPILSHTIKDLYGLHDTDPDSVFAEATLAILLQMAPLKRSMEMMDCVIRSFGDLAEFDGRMVHTWPVPGKISGLKLQSLGRCRLGYRAKRLLQLARAMRDRPITIEDLKLLSPEARRKRLLELPGIGDYSADIIGGGFPIDAWSADVFGKLLYGREPEEGRAAIEKIKAEGIRRWGEFAWLAFFYVVQDLGGLSRKLGISLRLQ